MIVSILLTIVGTASGFEASYLSLFKGSIDSSTLIDETTSSVNSETYPKLRLYLGIDKIESLNNFKMRITNVGNLGKDEYKKEFASKPTVMYCYGWANTSVNIDNEGHKLDVSSSLMYLMYRGFNTYLPETNFIIIQWNAYSGQDYLTAARSISKIADAIGDQLFKMAFVDSNPVDLNKWHLIGHSLGGHLVSLIARRVKAKTSGSFLMPRVTALDPAGPVVSYPIVSRLYAHLEKTDAKIVDVIGTDMDAFGSIRTPGSINFNVNNGFDQPGCGKNRWVLLNFISQYSEAYRYQRGCSHRRAYELYAASVYYSRNTDINRKEAFPAVKCDRLFYGRLECKNEVVHMGYNLEESASEGEYYLTTGSEFFEPFYDLGVDGVKPYLEGGLYSIGSITFQHT